MFRNLFLCKGIKRYFTGKKYAETHYNMRNRFYYILWGEFQIFIFFFIYFSFFQYQHILFSLVQSCLLQTSEKWKSMFCGVCFSADEIDITSLTFFSLFIFRCFPCRMIFFSLKIAYFYLLITCFMVPQAHTTNFFYWLLKKKHFM